jgi:hypothetical protein
MMTWSAGALRLPAGFTLVTPADQVIISIEAPRTAAQAEETSAPSGAVPEAPAEAPAAS